jgi:uncharacterized repeat protein (TIGR03803 family)
MRSRPPFPLWTLLAALLAFVPGLVTDAWAAPQYKVLYEFTGGADGGQPFGLMKDAAGNLYGTTGYAGDANCQCGTVFMLDKADKLTILHTFTGGNDGAFPYTTVALSGDKLYGAASSGGDLGCSLEQGCGLIFEIDLPTLAYRVIHVFHFDEGARPSGALMVRSGVLYGTTIGGGIADCDGGCGVVYQLVLKTGKFAVLHRFESSDGYSPESALTLDERGEVLYGTTAEGGSSGSGVVFRQTLSTGTFNVVYNFTGSPDAECPYGGLALDSSGNLYGDSQLGGSYPCRSEHGCGTVFMVNPATETDTVLYNFPGASDGDYPMAGITRLAKGTIYGTTAWGGLTDNGTVFQLVGDTETVLHAFQGSDGANPFSDVVVDSNGKLFGTTLSGGLYENGCSKYGCGVVWEITP